MKRALLIFSVLVFIALASVAYVGLALPNVGPPPDLKVEINPEKIALGKYLSHHVMMCAECHSQRDYSKFAGPSLPGTEFVGGEVFDQSMGFPGRFISPNITPAGIGDWTDGELFRLITTGVKRDGKPIFPVMPYHNYGKMAAEDIEAVIAYLRTLEPVDVVHPPSEVDFPFNLILNTIPEPASLSKKPSKLDPVAYGGYVFNAAACGECHTRFEDGKFTGPLGAGGREFAFPDGSILRTPNLTPHETGLAGMDRDAFIKRFKMYDEPGYEFHPVAPGDFQTIMPWAVLSGMEEEDLGAIWDYLRSLDPVDNFVERFTPDPLSASK